MRWVLVRDDEVVEVTTIEPAGRFPAGMRWVASETAEVGMRAADGGFRAAEPAAPVVSRLVRDHLLVSSDWTQLPDAPLDDGRRAAWAAYRQALRDLPDVGGPAPELPA